MATGRCVTQSDMPNFGIPSACSIGNPAKIAHCLRERDFDFDFAAGAFFDEEAIHGPARWADDELRFMMSVVRKRKSICS